MQKSLDILYTVYTYKSQVCFLNTLAFSCASVVSFCFTGDCECAKDVKEELWVLKNTIVHTHMTFVKSDSKCCNSN